MVRLVLLRPRGSDLRGFGGAQNKWPLYPKVAHYWDNVAQNCGPLAFQVGLFEDTGSPLSSVGRRAESLEPGASGDAGRGPKARGSKYCSQKPLQEKPESWNRTVLQPPKPKKEGRPAQIIVHTCSDGFSTRNLKYLVLGPSWKGSGAPLRGLSGSPKKGPDRQRLSLMLVGVTCPSLLEVDTEPTFYIHNINRFPLLLKASPPQM